MTYVLNQSTLVLEGVTLAQVVELVVEVLVDLAGGTVADEETTENTHAAHPEDLAVEREKHHISMDCSSFASSTGTSDVESFGNQQKGRMIDFLRTWAYGRPWYPCAYPDRGDDRYGGPRSTHGRGRGSAW
jgi:hypothetical protein